MTSLKAVSGVSGSLPEASRLVAGVGNISSTSLFCNTSVGASWPPFSQLFHCHLHERNTCTQNGCVPLFYSFSPSKVVQDFTPQIVHTNSQ